MNKRLSDVLDDKGFSLVFADERDNGRHWSSVADVACSLKTWCVSVPRRRGGPYHVAEVLHEVAHLELWRWTGKSPAKQRDLDACWLALRIAETYRFGVGVLEHLRRDLAEQEKEGVKQYFEDMKVFRSALASQKEAGK